ncbi:glycosyl transferase [Capsaspora owczarzaki ATCC 30864]|nr:glycosyl transferase [Capsaspora owczarzaki ATCC 30864]|eukprot:XP_004345492.1 glycosyl transferase [Capsaspora owczarzaki ATCC 30864]
MPLDNQQLLANLVRQRAALEQRLEQNTVSAGMLREEQRLLILHQKERIEQLEIELLTTKSRLKFASSEPSLPCNSQEQLDAFRSESAELAEQQLAQQSLQARLASNLQQQLNLDEAELLQLLRNFQSEVQRNKDSGVVSSESVVCNPILSSSQPRATKPLVQAMTDVSPATARLAPPGFQAVAHYRANGGEPLSLDMNWSSVEALDHFLAGESVVKANVQPRRAIPILSIVLPTYNGFAFLQEAVVSIQRQEMLDFELIIVDDGSTDSTPRFLGILASEWADKFEGKSILPSLVLLRQPNSRLPTALNTGFAAAKGRYLTWISSDNVHHANFTRVLVDTLDAYPEADWVISNHVSINNLGEYERVSQLTPFQLQYASLLGSNPGIMSFAYTRRCYDAVGDYDPSLEGVEDWEYWVRIRDTCGPYVIADTVLAAYRHHELSMSNTMTTAIANKVPIAYERTLTRVSRRENVLSLHLTDPTLQYVTRPREGQSLALLFSGYTYQYFSIVKHSPVLGLTAGELLSTCRAGTLFDRVAANVLFHVKEHSDHPRLAALSDTKLPSVYFRNPNTTQLEGRSSNLVSVPAVMCAINYAGYLGSRGQRVAANGVLKRLEAVAPKHPQQWFVREQVRLLKETNGGRVLPVDLPYFEFRSRQRLYEYAYTWSSSARLAHLGIPLQEDTKAAQRAIDGFADGFGDVDGDGIADDVLLSSRHLVLGIVLDRPIESFLKLLPSNLPNPEAFLQQYFNPSGMFTRVFCFSPYETAVRRVFGVYTIPTQPTDLMDRLLKYKVVLLRAFGAAFASDMAVHFGRAPGVRIIVSVHDDSYSYKTHESTAGADAVMVADERAVPPLLAKGIEQATLYPYYDPIRYAPVAMQLSEFRPRLPFNESAPSIGKLKNVEPYPHMAASAADPSRLAPGAEIPGTIETPELRSCRAERRQKLLSKFGESKIRVVHFGLSSELDNTVGVVAASALLSNDAHVICVRLPPSSPATDGTGSGWDDLLATKPTPAPRFTFENLEAHAKLAQTASKGSKKSQARVTLETNANPLNFHPCPGDDDNLRLAIYDAYLSIATLLFAPTLDETIDPVLILGALHAGVLVVASDVAPASKLIHHGITGYLLATPADPEELSVAFEAVARNTKMARNVEAHAPLILDRMSLDRLHLNHAILYRMISQLQTPLKTSPPIPLPGQPTFDLQQTNGNLSFLTLTSQHNSALTCAHNKFSANAPPLTSLVCNGYVYSMLAPATSIGWLLPPTHTNKHFFSASLAERHPVSTFAKTLAQLRHATPLLSPSTLRQVSHVLHCIDRFIGNDYTDLQTVRDITVAHAQTLHLSYSVELPNHGRHFVKVREVKRTHPPCRSVGSFEFTVRPAQHHIPWINILISNFNQGAAFNDTIRMFKLLKDYTNEQFLRLIVADYHSTDVDVDAMLKANGIEYILLNVPGNFSRAGGLQIASDASPSPQDINFSMDTFIVVPLNLFTLLRQHCQSGHSAFAPLVVRLSKEAPPVFSESTGYEEVYGWGMIAFVQEDNARIGGYDVERFREKRGGEDENFAGRLLWNNTQEFSIARVQADFFHIFHAHFDNHLWSKAGSETWANMPGFEPAPGVHLHLDYQPTPALAMQALIDWDRAHPTMLSQHFADQRPASVADILGGLNSASIELHSEAEGHLHGLDDNETDDINNGNEMTDTNPSDETFEA